MINKTISSYYKFVNARIGLFDNIRDNNHYILSPYTSEKNKVLIDFNCGHKPNLITPNSYKNGVRCPVCCGQKVEVGINDIATTHHELLIYFVNSNDAKTNSIGSKTYILFKCIICGKQKKMLAFNLLQFGFSCPKCGDGISYPNKFMYNLLEQLKEKFDREVKFDWCIFENYNNSNKNDYGIYDFVIENKKIIIEMDGRIGHGVNIHSQSDMSLEDTIYRDGKKDDLAKQNRYNIIRIDCKYKDSSKRFDYVKESILSSPLNSIYDLSKINWKLIHSRCLDSLVNEVCMLWEQTRDISQIIKTTKLSNNTVLRYLKDGASVGLCGYTYEEAIKLRSLKAQRSKMKPIKITYKNETFYSSSTMTFIGYYNDKYNKKLYYESIRQCLTNQKQSYKGFTFQYMTREEFNNIKSDSATSHLAIGDFFT